MTKLEASAGRDRPAKESLPIGRRALLSGAVAAAGVAGAAAASASAQEGSAVADVRPPRPMSAGSEIAIAETRYGRVAGYTHGDIFTFKGVPYGAPTGGANRFLPPRPPTSWIGVRSARHYGPVCPQDKGMGRFNDEEAFIFQWSDSVEDEDCLRLNVWTPGLRDGSRPVMVWLHGGAFAAGSGHDLPAFDGENLARRGDVVVVTLNHRLNALGYLDLSHCGERFAASGNVGMLDIVAALEWVRDNIAAFGGDPRRVLVFGQSGGGAKASALMAMPAAQGLFHRAIVMSGSFRMANTQAQSRRIADLILAELELTPSTAERLQQIAYLDLRRAAERVFARENAPFPGYVDVRRIATSLSFAPVGDGRVLLSGAFAPAAPSISRNVPMIIGSTLNEFVSGINHPEYEAMTDGELAAKIEAFQPGRGRRIGSAFRRRTPNASLFDLWSRVASAPVRQAAVDQATAKSALRGAPAYLYWFSWRTPVLDGRPRAFHCLDIPFAFANTDRCASMTGGGSDARALEAKVADAFIAFARSGDPNHAGLPRWPAFTSESGPSMVFDATTRVELHPDRTELSSIVPT